MVVPWFDRGYTVVNRGWLLFVCTKMARSSGAHEAWGHRESTLTKPAHMYFPRAHIGWTVFEP